MAWSDRYKEQEDRARKVAHQLAINGEHSVAKQYFDIADAYRFLHEKAKKGGY